MGSQTIPIAEAHSFFADPFATLPCRGANLASYELLIECGRDLRDVELWSELYERFRRKILTYLLRAYRLSGGRFRT